MIEDKIVIEVGILEVDFQSEMMDNMGYLVDIYRQPKKLKPKSVSLVYETLYERMAGWSGSDSQSNRRSVTRNPNFCNPVKGERVFSVQYSFGREDKTEWYTLGAIDEADAVEYVKKVNGSKMKIVKVMEQFYNPKTRKWESDN